MGFTGGTTGSNGGGDDSTNSAGAIMLFYTQVYLDIHQVIILVQDLLLLLYHKNVINILFCN